MTFKYIANKLDSSINILADPDICPTPYLTDVI